MRRQTKNNGQWADLVAEGIVGVHIGDTGTVHGFEAEDIDALAEAVRRAGFEAKVIDETFGRTLRIENPDDPSQEAEIWVNSATQDSYGYMRHGN